LEVSMRFTETGPVFHLRGARLQLEAPADVQVGCGKISVHSRDCDDKVPRLDGKEEAQANQEST
jgi:hypothetical protein